MDNIYNKFYSYGNNDNNTSFKPFFSPIDTDITKPVSEILRPNNPSSVLFLFFYKYRQ